MINKETITNKQNGLGIGRVLKATICSIKGFKAAWQHESAFRQEILLTVLLVPISFLLATSSTHWVALIVSLLFLLFAEIINSALEALADKVCVDQDELIGRTKDLGSSGVFLAICILFVVWGEAIYGFLIS